MSIRRLTTLLLLLCLNLFVGIMYIQPSKILTFISYPPTVNDTEILLTGSERFPNESVAPEEQQQGTPLSFNFSLNPRDLCSSKNKTKLSLIILVCTAIPNVRQRRAIRETWGSIASNNSGQFRLAFLLGSSREAALQELIKEEFYQFGDIIQQNFIDSYKNLTLKSLMLLEWVSHYCPNVQYVLKTDDDMYVNVANLFKMLVRVPVKSNVMYGILFKKAKPNRNPAAKWFVPKTQYDGDVFPDYLSGTGYVASRDVIPGLLEASNALPFLVMEDVFITGLCASECHVRRFNVRGFAYWRRPPTGCAFRDAITGHHVTPSDMRKIWKELLRKSICHQSKRKF